MDDLWGNAWSASGSKEHADTSKKSHIDGPRWNTFERDADDNTVDVGVPSWSAAGWDDGPSNLWQAETSTVDAWGTNVTREVEEKEEEEEEEEEEPEAEAADEQSEDGKDLAPQTILPTPPQSPLRLPSPTPGTPPAETPPPSPPVISAVPSSPDPFGSFESAEVEAEDEVPLPPPSWTPKTATFPPEATDEPWGGAWGGRDDGEEEDEGDATARKDEWELAQEAKRRQERKVPPELLGSLVTQWDEFAKEIYTDIKVDNSGSQSWRRGMDNVEGLADLVDSLLPVASLPPPVQLSNTGVAKAVRESLRVTRSFALTRSSPMAHLYASKGSNDWEKSVKAQKTAANDEWGWDLKHELEEKPEPADTSKEKKGGLLSFWSRKASSIPSTPAGDSSVSNQPKSPTAANHPKSPLASKPASPITSARPSIDLAASTTPSVTTPTAIASPSVQANIPVETSPPDGATAQPSAVSRFFNRFSRKPSATAVASENQSSLTLSDNDFSLLSDMVPSASRSSLSHGGTDSVGSLEAMLSSSSSGPRYSSASSSKLPPPLAPPPPPSSRSAGPSSAVSHSSDSSFDAKMVEAQLMDVMSAMTSNSAGSGYTPVSFDLIDSSVVDEPPPLSASRVSGSSTPMSRLPVRPAAPPPLQGPQMVNGVRRTAQLSPSTLSPVLPPPLPPPTSSSPQPLSGTLTPPPIPPPRPLADTSKRSSIAIHRFDNPLPPTPQRDVDDFSEFFSAPMLPVQRLHSQTPPQPAPSSLNPTTPNFFPSSAEQQTLFTPTAGTDSSSDFGDFGDFVSQPIRSPSPPKVPRKTSRAANHKPTMVLVEKAASRPGRWPAPPSPLPQPLAPPPDSQRAQQDLLGNDSPETFALAPEASSSSTLPPPMFTLPPPRPASTSFPAVSPSPKPLSSPFVAKPPSTTPQPGLSAQDLSFFEGL